MSQIIPVSPIVKMFDFPGWHHHHSSKLSVSGIDNIKRDKKRSLKLKSNSVDVIISHDPRRGGWLVIYEIRHTSYSKSKGEFWMSENDLKTAFGLSNECEGDWGQSMLIDYGGDVAYQGKYIRYGNYLNIPGPGTGHDGDPNVSIRLNDEIKRAVELLLQQS